VTGREFTSRQDRAEDLRLVLGPDGATLRSGPASVTVPVRATAAILRWDDGGRDIVGLDASRIAVEPTLWDGGAGTTELVDRYWPADLTVAMGARGRDEIPVPDDARFESAARRLLLWLLVPVGAGLVALDLQLGGPSFALPMLAGAGAVAFLERRKARRAVAGAARDGGPGS
jgi:hypothetical protein